MIRVMFPLLFDVTTEYLSESVWSSLDHVRDHFGTQNFNERMCEFVIEKCYDLICNYSNAER